MDSVFNNKIISFGHSDPLPEAFTKGTGALLGIVPLALLHIDNLLERMKSCIVNTVHDSIAIDMHPEEKNAVIGVIDKTNKELSSLISSRWGISFNVPLLLEAKIGYNWLDTKDVI